MVTPKQQKLIKLVLENLGNPKNTKTLGELILAAGYSEATAKNPKLIFKSPEIKEGLSDFVSSLEDKRKQAITYITPQKLAKAQARDLAYLTDIFTKNIQLLNGGKTSNDELKIKWE